MNISYNYRSLFSHSDTSAPSSLNDALIIAHNKKRPILLTIGTVSSYYSTLLASELSTDTTLIKKLNDNFVCLNIDKDEYLDFNTYAEQVSLIFTRTMGHPLICFLLPNGKIYFAETYFPFKFKIKSNLWSLIDKALIDFETNLDKIEQDANSAEHAITQGLINKEKVEYVGHYPPPQAILAAVKQFKNKEHGGHGDPPLFPNFSFYKWGIEQILEGMVEKEDSKFIVESLESMLMSPICDHARGGIFHFLVDRKWPVPHFEKLLINQAEYLSLLSKLGLIYPSPIIFDGLINTLEYVETELLSESNCFFNANGSASEGVEGLYHTYTLPEFEKIIKDLSETEQKSAISLFNISKKGNFYSGLNMISLNKDKSHELFSKEGWELVRKIRKLIIFDRQNRIPPKTDTTLIANANFRMISALNDVYRFNTIDVIKDKALDIIKRSFDSIIKEFVVSTDPFTIASTSTRESHPLFIDYSYFAESLIKSYESTGDDKYFNLFEKTINFIFENFIDDNYEDVYTRPINLKKDIAHYPNLKLNSLDILQPAPISIFVDLITKASLLLSDPEFSDKIKNIKETIINESLKNPLSSGTALSTLTYPIDSYKMVSIPQQFRESSKFKQIIHYFTPRFIFKYHNKDKLSWQIQNINAVEIQGEGLDNFIEILIPKKSDLK